MRILKFVLILLLFYIELFSLNKIKLGIDVLIENDFAIIKNKKVAILANFTARNSVGIETIKLLQNRKSFDFKYIFTPEHGYFTNVPAGIAVENDSVYGIPLYSLYGNQKMPARQLMNDIDAIIIDIQDIGVRSYTYISTIYQTMLQAAIYKKDIIILDRPNPIGGLIVDGNVLDRKFKSFVGIVPISYIHGLTIGELATMINNEGWLQQNDNKPLKCNLTIVKMQKWERWMNWEDTGLDWYPTSPHVPTIASVRGIATLGIFGELGMMSIGIGTTSPFQYLGHNIFEPNKLIEIANNISLDGINLNVTKYRPFYGFSNGKDIWGFYLKFLINNDLKPYTSGILLAKEIQKNYPELFDANKIDKKSIEMFNKVTGTDQIFKAIFENISREKLLKLVHNGLNDFLKLRNKYLLYN